ncbi:hypothetical protein BH09SUM1_BH09SUM1_00680 [soil metagenome]
MKFGEHRLVTVRELSEFVPKLLGEHDWVLQPGTPSLAAMANLHTLLRLIIEANAPAFSPHENLGPTI